MTHVGLKKIENHCLNRVKIFITHFRINKDDDKSRVIKFQIMETNCQDARMPYIVNQLIMTYEQFVAFYHGPGLITDLLLHVTSQDKHYSISSND